MKDYDSEELYQILKAQIKNEKENLKNYYPKIILIHKKIFIMQKNLYHLNIIN